MDEFEQIAQAHLDGLATEDEIRLLTADEDRWIFVLGRLFDEASSTLRRVRSQVRGPEREVVLEDFQAELDRIDELLVELTGESAMPAKAAVPEPVAIETSVLPSTRDAMPTGVSLLQLSYQDGLVVAWAGAQGVAAEPVEVILERLENAGAPGGVWNEHEPISLPGGTGKAPTVAAPAASTLGWLVSLGDSDDESLAASTIWVGLVAALAVQLVAEGRMVPQLEKAVAPEDHPKPSGGRSTFAVTWAPAVLEDELVDPLVKGLPGAVSAYESRRDRRTFTRDVVGGFVDAICRDAASKIEVPEPSPSPRTVTEVSETILSRLDGTIFDASNQHGGELSRGLQRWAKPVTGSGALKLVITLDPPDDSNAWHFQTMVPDNNKLEAAHAAMSNAPNNRRDQIKRELDRLERLFPPLERTKSSRRGEVILSQEEAWDLMSVVGPVLTSAGFDVRVPPLKRRKAKPQLRLTSMADPTAETQVGAQQLTAVKWSAVFDDVELDAAQIRALAAESRPLVKSRGKWVEVDRADLAAAAAALEERAKQTHLTGADMLRHALGLEGAPLGSEVSVVGEGWAADLLTSARAVPKDPPTTLEGFEGELRGYQAQSLAWLGFLDNAGLGGCLALDMGLGKTPTMLAHLRAGKGTGPALVIAPPAVVGNWAAEAKRFVPDMDVLVHHGASRADEEDIAGLVNKHDVIITTFGTAVRDIEALEPIQWARVVLDEGQVIKNHTSDTAQQLRRLNARTRVVLTGTPIENGLGDLWSLMDYVNPGLVGERTPFIAQLSEGRGGGSTEKALRALNGVLVFRRTKAEPAIAAELPDRIDELDHCPMTEEQIGLYQAVLDQLVDETAERDQGERKKGAVLAAITALKQICNHPVAYTGEDDKPLIGRSGKLTRLEEIVDNVYEANERVLVFTHFASWGEKLAKHLTEHTGTKVNCYHGGLSRGARDRMIEEFQKGEGAGALVLSLKAGGTGLNLTAASHVVLYDRWWNPAVEDQARDRAWRIGQTKTVVAHRLVCPGTVDERVEEVVQGKRKIADMVLPKASSVEDLDSMQLRAALGIDEDAVLRDDDDELLGEVTA